jgi:hypothetical protein
MFVSSVTVFMHICLPDPDPEARERKEAQVGEIARPVFFLIHVKHGEELDEEADHRDDGEHEEVERIEKETRRNVPEGGRIQAEKGLGLDLRGAEPDPFEHLGLQEIAVEEQADIGRHRDARSHDGDPGREGPRRLLPQEDQDARGERGELDEPDEFEHQSLKSFASSMWTEP